MNTENFLTINEAYGFNPINFIQTRDGLLFTNKSAVSETYILKQVDEGFERKKFIYSVHNYLNSRGFSNTDGIILTKNNELTVNINDKKYICNKVVSGRQSSADNLQDAKKAAGLLACMHNSGDGFTTEKAASLNSEVVCESEINYVKNDLGQLQELFEHRSKELARFNKLAARGKGVFDYEYKSIADKYCNRAKDLCRALKESKYEEISEDYRNTGAVCHKDFAFHNVMLSDSSNGGIINFDRVSIDLPLFDLTNLIKRRMKKCGWRVSEAYEILEEYSQLRELSKYEIEIMRIILAFPQKLWRIVNKYYNTRRSWCEKSCLIKLAEIESENEIIDKFLKEFIF